MYFNEWVQQQIKDLQITRRSLCETTGISYSSLNLSKAFEPRLCNLVLICEVLNEERGGDLASIDALILEAIRVSNKEYKHAKNRLQENV